MRLWSKPLAWIGLLVLCIGAPMSSAQDAAAPPTATAENGTLIVEIKPFTS